MQIIDYCKKNTEIKNVIFVTDDNKEDWWYILNSNGKKTIGPRPELIHEITSSSNVNNFLMYNTENFLEASNKYLDAKIEENIIQDVKEVSEVSDEFDFHTINNHFEIYLNETFGSFTYEFVPDYAALRDGKKYAFELIKDDAGIVYNNEYIIKRLNSCNDILSDYGVVTLVFEFSTAKLKIEAFQYLNSISLSVFSKKINYIMLYSIDEDISISKLFVKIPD
ncbi:hypothetical protein C0W42_21550 [Photobacterium kishitanii]|nr:hypothetical protein C0W42_21550 [Photobacterium kishitanii]